MIFKVLEKITKRLKKRNYKTYILFLGFTTFLWLALQFSKNYSQEVTFEIEYSEIQTNKIIKPNSDQEIKMVLDGNGFQLLKYSWFKKEIVLDARKARVLSKNHSFFTGKSMINTIKSSLDYTGEIPFVLKDSLHIYYDVFKEKEIPIKLISEVSYSQGYTSIKGVESTEKTVQVIGPKSIVDTLTFVETEILKLDNVKKNYQGQLALKSDKEIDYLSFDKNKIPVTLFVNKLTEGEVKVPITLLNIPKETKIQLFPKQISVIFNVGLKDYAKLSAKDFKVTADLSNISETNDKLLLKLASFPSNVFNARLSEKEVEYIIIK